jgi:hypothetical protein
MTQRRLLIDLAIHDVRLSRAAAMGIESAG